MKCPNCEYEIEKTNLKKCPLCGHSLNSEEREVQPTQNTNIEKEQAATYPFEHEPIKPISEIVQEEPQFLCPHCHEPVEKDNNFCPNCGKPIRQQIPVSPQTPPEPTPSNSEPEPIVKETEPLYIDDSYTNQNDENDTENLIPGGYYPYSDEPNSEDDTSQEEGTTPSLNWLIITISIILSLLIGALLYITTK